MSAQFLTEPNIPICVLEAKDAFDSLAEADKLYAHHLGKASWAGFPVVLQQVSPESPKIFNFLMKLFKQVSLEDLQKKSGVTEEEWLRFSDYVSNFLGNGGNYRSFGDSKFIPVIGPEIMTRIAEVAGPEVLTLWKEIAEAVYDVSPNKLELGWPGLN